MLSFSSLQYDNILTASVTVLLRMQRDLQILHAEGSTRVCVDMSMIVSLVDIYVVSHM